MALYEKKWWKKMFQKKEHPEKFNVLHDIQTVREFLQDVTVDLKRLNPDLKKLEELETELEVMGSEQLRRVNLQTQVEIIERILENYESFENDVDINGIRIKQISQNFLKQADKWGLVELVNEKKQNPKWKFYW